MLSVFLGIGCFFLVCLCLFLFGRIIVLEKSLQIESEESERDDHTIFLLDKENIALQKEIKLLKLQKSFEKESQQQLLEGKKAIAGFITFIKAYADNLNPSEYNTEYKKQLHALATLLEQYK